jgi:hypothetical protein
MTAEQERAAVVAWLKDAPFPWMRKRSGILGRIQSAWRILVYGEATIHGLLSVVAIKVQRGDHHK